MRLSGPSPRRMRVVWLCLSLFCLVLFSVPLVVCLWVGADFTDLANESMAYRYFFVERVLGGETIVVGVGYLVSLVHHVAYALVEHVLLVPGLDLRARINAFALLSSGIIVALMGIVFWVAGQSRSLNAAQKTLVLTAGLLPLYGNGFMGFDYALMADYHHLDMVLMAACVLMFVRNWMASEEESTAPRILRNALLVGVFAANKVTVLPAAGIVLLPLLVGRSVRIARLLPFGLLGAGGLALGFCLVHLAAYLGRVSAVRTMVPIWAKFVGNPGGEPNFWTTTFLKQFWSYNTGLFCLFFVLVAAASIALLTVKKQWSVRSLACGFTIAVAAALYSYAVIKRPAGSTVFESGDWMLVLALMLLGMLSTMELGRRLAACSAAALLLVAVISFPVEECMTLVRLSKPNADTKFAFFRRVFELADGRPIIVFLVDNSPHHEGVHELLLKGASSFPSWHLSEGGRAMLATYAPGVTFRSSYEPNPALDAPIPEHSVLVLFRTPDSEPLTRRFPAVGAYSTLPTSRQEDWSLPRKKDGFVVGTIVYPTHP